jgi:uncharacterized protein YeaO (DUF488 family)
MKRPQGGDIVKMKLTSYQCGSARKKGEGLRIGTVRFLPRGVKKEDYTGKDYFDVWLPAVAPSRELFASIKGKQKDKKAWDNFTKKYINEMKKTDKRQTIKKKTDKRQTIKLLSELSKKTPIAIGCYCEDENYCHRSILKKLILDS